MDGFFFVIAEQFSALGTELSIRARPSDDVLLKKHRNVLEFFLTRVKGLGVVLKKELDDGARVEIISACALYCQQIDRLRASMFKDDDEDLLYDPLVSKTVDECLKKTFGDFPPDVAANLRVPIIERYRGPVLETMTKYFDGLEKTDTRHKKKKTPMKQLTQEEWDGMSQLQKLVWSLS